MKHSLSYFRICVTSNETQFVMLHNHFTPYASLTFVMAIITLNNKYFEAKSFCAEDNWRHDQFERVEQNSPCHWRSRGSSLPPPLPCCTLPRGSWQRSGHRRVPHVPHVHQHMSLKSHSPSASCHWTTSGDTAHLHSPPELPSPTQALSHGHHHSDFSEPDVLYGRW